MYRCAIIGCGGVSRSHTGFYPAWSRARLVACADPYPPALERTLELLPGCRAYTDYRDLLRRESPDLVVIATRANLHREITCAAAEAGVKAILCEKPMALDRAGAREMIDTCRERKVRLVIGHQRRYDPQYVRAMELIRDGVLGGIVAAEAYWPCSAAAYLGGHCAAVDGGGFVMYLGVHVFDMLAFCLGRIDRVSARLGKKIPDGDIEDSAVCHLRMDSGVTAGVHLGEFSHDIAGVDPAVSPLRFFITGTEGTLTFGDFGYIAWLRRSGSSAWEELKPPAEGSGKTGFQRLHEAILESLETGSPTRCDGETALLAQEAAMACYASFAKGGSIRLDEVPSHSPMQEILERWGTGRWPDGIGLGG